MKLNDICWEGDNNIKIVFSNGVDISFTANDIQQTLNEIEDATKFYKITPNTIVNVDNIYYIITKQG